MLVMRDHDVEDYKALRDMDATDVGELHADDRACLEELGQYLVTTDAWQRFGIWLLHKHFLPEPGEVFVEQTVRSPRGTKTSPIDRSAFGQLSATAVRFYDQADGLGMVGMEFAEPDDFGDTEPLSDDDAIVLAGIAERLQAYDKTERFGVRLIRNPLGLTDEEMLHETTDSGDRTMNCTVGDRAEVLVQQNVTQTAWKWRVVHGGPETIVMQDCTAGCVRVGEGHDTAHTASGTDDFDNPTTGEPDTAF
ncbi:hypothetical protein A5784_17145 [Mycobacterium sp. 852013-50091_SCH5140682]|uniref:hypothetical protein n=1 Tax=Mycobacterium sp. 852013-50091_SCH5140682 TaxID=1834109 RepID=UPI0007EAFAC7|nr:hypothetical protein [Mycobacterium sp. 852013-50091_SCH5140682]OBC01828.1 hypothetical protein A5784_17145 [Mycobacterium sp. 852013-50091_SCH5140682]